jgi:hypothetical protein
MRTFQAFPYHWTIDPREDELRRLLRENNAVGLRYSTAIDVPLGYLSYHAILEERAYDIESLGKWARKNIRRGLRNCTVEPISFKFLAGEGWILQQDTLDRQRRGVRRDREEWERLCLSAADLPGFEAWGALVQGRLAASVISFHLEDCCYLLYQQCKREYLAAHVNNALSFMVTQTMVQRPRVRSIFYGLHSLDAPASVDEFKFRMGYVPKPVRQRVLFRRCWSPLVNPLTHALIRAAKAARPRNPVLAKAEGMIRFYLEGERALSKHLAPRFSDSREQPPETKRSPTPVVQNTTTRVRGELQQVSAPSFEDEDR